MVPEKSFCTNCGAALDRGAKFCGSCGQKVSASTAEAAPAPTTVGGGDEKLVGIIPAVSRKKGFLSMEAFNVVVTERRMIFAIMTPEMIKEAAKQERKKGLAGVFSAAFVGYTLHERYLDMPPEAALNENPENFAVDLGAIKKVKVKGGNSWVRSGVTQYEQGQLEIETAGEKYKFTMPHDTVDNAKEVLRQVRLI
jgi:hypothetical protein